MHQCTKSGMQFFRYIHVLSSEYTHHPDGTSQGQAMHVKIMSDVAEVLEDGAHVSVYLCGHVFMQGRDTCPDSNE